MHRTLRVLVLVVAVLPATVAAQSRPSEGDLLELRPGARVRLRAPGVLAGRLEGTVLTRAPDTISVGSPTVAPIAIPIARISALELSRGKSRSAGATRGLEWGIGIGALVGLALAPAIGPCHNCERTAETMSLVATSIAGGAMYGALIGALVGRERWEGYDLSYRTSAIVQPRRATIALTYRF